MKFKLALAALTVAGIALLAGCSAATPAATPTPKETTRGTITMPGEPVIPSPTPSATATPAPSGSPNAGFPRKGVDPQGVDRDSEAEQRFLGLVGYGGEPLLDAQGRTYTSVIEATEGTLPSEDYLLNIVYAGCAEALADTAATPIDQMVQQIVNQTAATLDYAVADDVVENGYAPVIRTGLAELCGTKFASLTSKVG